MEFGEFLCELVLKMEGFCWFTKRSNYGRREPTKVKGTLNSAYDTVCRKCGTTPSCEYVKQHQPEILRWLENMNAKGH
jgi:hypothetical protein